MLHFKIRLFKFWPKILPSRARVCMDVCVCMYVCMCTVCIRRLMIINKSIYEMSTFIHLLRRQLLACGIMLPAAFQGAPRSQPSEIMLSEWVSHPPQRVRAAAGCAWWCAGQCARKRRTTEAPPGFCPSSCNSGPNRVWFSFFLLSLFLYFSLLFVLPLVLPFPFPFYFCLVQYLCLFCIAVL